MQILILEDDLAQQRRIREAIQINGQISDRDIFVTSRVSELLEQADKYSEGNVYFLDLEIRGEEKAGFAAAATIREKDLFGPVIFVTTHSELAPVTFEYQVSALDFIAKDLLQPDFEEKIKTCLIKANRQIQTLGNEFDTFSFQNKYCSFQVPFYEILYFETSEIPHKLRLVTEKKEMEFYAELKEVEEKDDRLFRCHRSYLVNLERIRAIDKKNRLVSFENGSSCLISRRYVKELQEKINEI